MGMNHQMTVIVPTETEIQVILLKHMWFYVITNELSTVKTGDSIDCWNQVKATRKIESRNSVVVQAAHEK